MKIDAVPGRLNERWFRVLPGFEGRYYGQCSELCGERHAYMPITVDVVSPAKYEAWLTEQKIELGLLEATPAAVETPADITPVEAESVDAVEDSPADISIPETNNNAAPAAVQDEAAE